jgi:hypothetical protein
MVEKPLPCVALLVLLAIFIGNKSVGLGLLSVELDWWASRSSIKQTQAAGRCRTW